MARHFYQVGQYLGVDDVLPLICTSHTIRNAASAITPAPGNDAAWLTNTITNTNALGMELALLRFVESDHHRVLASHLVNLPYGLTLDGVYGRPDTVVSETNPVVLNLMDALHFLSRTRAARTILDVVGSALCRRLGTMSNLIIDHYCPVLDGDVLDATAQWLDMTFLLNE